MNQVHILRVDLSIFGLLVCAAAKQAVRAYMRQSGGPANGTGTAFTSTATSVSAEQIVRIGSNSLRAAAF
jgi:hypothetical protein